MSGNFSELSDDEDLQEWIEEFAENRTEELKKYQEENPGEELEGEENPREELKEDETDASPADAARGILKPFNL